MKILFVLPRMVSGGVERVALKLVKGLQERGHECAFALRRAYGELLPEAQALCPVHEVTADSLHQFVPNLAKLIKTWKPTHIVTAFSDVGVLTHLAIKRSGLQLLWVHGVHSTHDIVTARPGWIGRARYHLDNFFSALVYKKANKIVAVSNGVREDILHQFEINIDKVVTIYNPVLDESQIIPRTRKENSGDPPKIVALGRLTRQKGFDTLIEAMAQVPQPWQLEIWGEGEERAALQNLIEANNLQHNISLCGYTRQPLEVLRQADIFVLSSRYEGFGLVLVEALASGCQIVATDCPHGPREILKGGVFGALVKNKSAKSLAIGIIKTLKKEHSISNSLQMKQAKTFSVEQSTLSWEATLLEA